MMDDPIIAEYVNRVGQNLARNSDAKVPFTFQVIDDDTLNAFALPGGFVFVHTGLIHAAETEAEMASAMAHEIAHVAARHMTRQACRAQIANIATIPLIFLGGWRGYAIRQGAGLAIPMTFLSFSRGFEAEADYLGLQYLYAAGYDPTASIDMFEKMMSLQKRKPGSIAKVFSTHPMNDDRLKKTQAEIAKDPAAEGGIRREHLGIHGGAGARCWPWRTSARCVRPKRIPRPAGAAPYTRQRSAPASLTRIPVTIAQPSNDAILVE